MAHLGNRDDWKGSQDTRRKEETIEKHGDIMGRTTNKITKTKLKNPKSK